MAVSYVDIRQVADTKKRLIDEAIKQIHSQISERTTKGIYDAVMNAIQTYGVASQEIGAQWYEKQAQEAGVNVPRAQIGDLDMARYSTEIEDALADWELGELTDEDLEHWLDEYVGETLQNASRGVVFDNMRRDDVFDWRVSERDRRVRYARVPVGETCAWCLMLASLGFWYLDEDRALFRQLDGDRFHSHCDCEVVAYTDPMDIDGYAETLGTYRDMYYDARETWENGEVSDELKARIDKAHEEHDAKYAQGLLRRRWSETNEILIVMRDFYGLD